MRRILCSWILLFAVTAFAPVHAQERHALLIGNKAYTKDVGPLTNPHNDIGVVGVALKQIGFDKQTPLRDQKRSQILAAVRSHAGRLASAGVGATGFLYYSGHGAAAHGTNVNYIIPVDAADPKDDSFWDELVKLEEIVRILQERAPRAVHFVVFDACRNELLLPEKNVSKGLVPIPTPDGMLVGFASQFGATASDAGQGSGPYAKALAAELVKPGQSHLDLFQNVREAVVAATGNKQRPYELNGLSQRVRLGPAAELPKEAAKAPAPQNPAVATASPATSTLFAEALAAWPNVRDSRNEATLEAFIRRYGETFFGDQAKVLLAEIKEAKAAAERQRHADATKAWAAFDQLKTDIGSGIAQTETAVRQRIALLDQQKQDAAAAQKKAADDAKRDPALAVTPGSGQSFRDAQANGQPCPMCPEMVVAPKGEFMMGSPASEPERDSDETQVKVTIPRPFAAGKFAVTFAEWDACVADGGCNGYKPNDKTWGRVKHPVINVNWDDAKAYVAWLSKKAGKNYRLLSEAEREYITRAGTTIPFWWGPSITPAQANYDGSADPYKGGGSKGEYRQRTMPVDSFKPNLWGLYNVHGNVWEWTEDCWNASNTGNPGNGVARTTGECSRRVVRGGSWGNGPRNLRSAYRSWSTTDIRSYGLGFRVARTY